MTAAGAATSRRRGRAIVLVSAAVVGLLVLGSTALPWAHARIAGSVAGPGVVSASGRDAAPVVTALALVILAACVASAVGRRVAGVMSAAALVLAGAGVAVASIAAALDPEASAAPAVVQATGQAGAQLSAHSTAWPWGAALLGLAAAVAGVAALLRPGRARGLPSRYEPPRADEPVADWDALSEGRDPTAE